ncbi:hypothetical protein HPB50_003745 [Hyalomma asiaticum]|uniref:Uncharacterized protein n=1 Tax=Hyalomma asiaticum TaxID=266040 RepID=A0ACB7SSC0_HYAAI|nr:hypothetical protein HPB50_003745 [Hyalomma asiaticum]
MPLSTSVHGPPAATAPRSSQSAVGIKPSRDGIDGGAKKEEPCSSKMLGPRKHTRRNARRGHKRKRIPPGPPILHPGTPSTRPGAPATELAATRKKKLARAHSCGQQRPGPCLSCRKKNKSRLRAKLDRRRAHGGRRTQRHAETENQTTIWPRDQAPKVRGSCRAFNFRSEFAANAVGDTLAPCKRQTGTYRTWATRRALRSTCGHRLRASKIAGLAARCSPSSHRSGRPRKRRAPRTRPAVFRSAETSTSPSSLPVAGST